MEEFAQGSPAYGGTLPEKGTTWKVSEKKIATWIITELYLRYKPKDEKEAQKLMDKKRIRFRQIESPSGYSLATLVNGRNKVLAQTSILNFIEYET